MLSFQPRIRTTNRYRPTTVTVDTAYAEQTFQGQLKASLRGISQPITTDTSLRLQRVIALFRALIGVVLIVAGLAFTEPRLLGERYPTLFLSTALLYTLVAWLCMAYMVNEPRKALSLVPGLLFFDIACISIMMHSSGGISSGIGGLLIVFVGAGCLNLVSRHAFLGASLAALAVLGEQAMSFVLGQSPASAFLPAGVLGGIIFTITSLASVLSRRLQESEELGMRGWAERQLVL